MKLQGKVALITGATSGMGQAIAEIFVREGAQVALIGRDLARGDSIAEDLGTSAQFYPCDVSQASEVEAMVELVAQDFGGIDILVPNAGVLGIGKVTDLEVEDWHQTLNTNLNHVFYIAKYGLPHLIARGGGTVVINASIAAYKSFPNHPAYCASKGALVPLTRSLAMDYAADKIRVNCLCPGPVDTPLIWNSAQAFPNPTTVVQEVGESTLMGRLGTPGDIAQAALFLVSEDSSWMTGSALTLDGGVLAG